MALPKRQNDICHNCVPHLQCKPIVVVSSSDHLSQKIGTLHLSNNSTTDDSFHIDYSGYHDSDSHVYDMLYSTSMQAVTWVTVASAVTRSSTLLQVHDCVHQSPGAALLKWGSQSSDSTYIVEHRRCSSFMVSHGTALARQWGESLCTTSLAACQHAHSSCCFCSSSAAKMAWILGCCLQTMEAVLVHSAGVQQVLPGCVLMSENNPFTEALHIFLE